jgi:hypothetical protein
MSAGFDATCACMIMPGHFSFEGKNPVLYLFIFDRECWKTCEIKVNWPTIQAAGN